MIKYYVARQTVKSALDAIDLCNKNEESSCEVHFGAKVYLINKLRHKDEKFNYNNFDKWFKDRIIYNGAKIYKNATTDDLWIYFPITNELWRVHKKMGVIEK